MMQVENLTQFTAATVVWLLRAGKYRLSVIVKAGFSMHEEGVLKTSEEQPLPGGDEPALEGPNDLAVLERASDAVAFKPRAELLLKGTAYVAHDRGLRTVARVGVQAGNLTKSLAVFGPRVFQGQLGDAISEPEPLTQMPLTYANAYGGKGDRRNPVGKGRDGSALPNIEYLDRLIHSPADRPPPAGFGPISPNWEPRRGMMGTYGGDYVEKYWPGFPPDFDWGYFNAAPRDQQFEGYLRGDEDIALEGMHPEQQLIRTRLPGIRIIAIREDHDGNIARLPMNLDTLRIDADALSFHLTWRSVTEVATFEALEIKRLGFLAESVDAPELDAAAYKERLDAMIEERDREFEEEAPPPETEPEAPEEEPAPTAVEQEDPLPPDVAAQLEAIRKQFPQPEPPAEPPELSPEAQAEVDRILAESEEAAEARWTREQVIAAVDAGASLADADLSNLDLSGYAFGAVDFRGAKLEAVDFHDSDLSGARFAECVMDKVQLDGATLRGADLSAAKLAGASLCRADLHKSTLDGADLEDAKLQDSVLVDAQCAGTTFTNASLLRASLVQADFTNTDFTGAQLDDTDMAACTGAGALFANATLVGAAFSSAQLEGADFSEADLTDSRLPSANLVDASGSGARLTGADLRHADLTGADFNGADLSEALLDGATATDANFTEANLGKASLRRAHLEGSWLSSAVIDGADLQEADCTDLQLDGTRARRTTFYRANVPTLRGSAGADFTDADFRQASGTEPIFEGCIVGGANFSHADLPGANFIQVSALQTNFTAVDMPEARFTLADCREAVFDSANLFEGSLEAADLSRAVLDNANCYGVEFLDATLRGATVEGTNVLMTKFSN